MRSVGKTAGIRKIDEKVTSEGKIWKDQMISIDTKFLIWFLNVLLFGRD